VVNRLLVSTSIKVPTASWNLSKLVLRNVKLSPWEVVEAASEALGLSVAAPDVYPDV
jgi:hypothetical protein